MNERSLLVRKLQLREHEHFQHYFQEIARICSNLLEFAEINYGKKIPIIEFKKFWKITISDT